MLHCSGNGPYWGGCIITEKAPDKVEVLRTEDALSIGTEILAPQLGTDGIDLADQIVDVLRFTRLNKLEILPIMYYLGEDEDSWIHKSMKIYMNLKMSEEGHERSVLVVKALQALGGRMPQPKKKKDTRNIIERNLTRRNKGPDDEE